jgi:hypothetical protein
VVGGSCGHDNEDWGSIRVGGGRFLVHPSDPRALPPHTHSLLFMPIISGTGRARWVCRRSLRLVPEVLGSNHGRDTGYLVGGFTWFSSVPISKYQDTTTFTP